MPAIMSLPYPFPVPTPITTKLHGYDFYESIGRPVKVVAPMVDQSELPYRLLCRKYGADLCYTPMFHSRLFATDPKYREEAFGVNSSQDRPLIVQFCSNDPDMLLSAARFVEGRCDAVDINLGCPQVIRSLPCIPGRVAG